MSAFVSATCTPPGLDPDLDPDIATEELPPVNAFMAAFTEVKPMAATIPEERLRVINVHAELAFVNAKEGYAAIEAQLPFIRTIPGVDVEAIESVPRYSLAFLGATHRLNLVASPDSALPTRLTRARQVRKGLLHIAQGAAALGLVPSAAVKRIAKGSGSLDTARDLIELAMLFRDFDAACRGKLTIDTRFLDEATELGTWLRDTLRPADAMPRPKDVEIREATLDRARIWTLLSEAYDELLRVAAFLRIDVPSLQSRRGMKKKPKPEA